MKTHKNKRLKKELLIVELPEGVKIFYDEDDEGNHIGYSLAKFEKYSVQSFGLVEGYTLLGKPDEIMEEDVEMLVEKSIHTGLFAHYVKGIPVNTYCYKTAKESLLSLLESEIYWDVNPIPTPEIQGGYDELGNFHGGWDDNWISAFEEAEQKTFNRNRTLIFVEK